MDVFINKLHNETIKENQCWLAEGLRFAMLFDWLLLDCVQYHFQYTCNTTYKIAYNINNSIIKSVPSRLKTTGALAVMVSMLSLLSVLILVPPFVIIQLKACKYIYYGIT